MKNELQNQQEQSQEEISELRDILRRLEMENRDMKMLIGKQYGLHHPTTEPVLFIYLIFIHRILLVKQKWFMDLENLV